MNNADNFFQSLCEQYYADLGNFLLALTKDRELAQDLLQETFIVAWNKRELLLTHPNPAGFLFQTARLCLKHARQKQKKQQSRVLYLDREQLAQEHQRSVVCLRMRALRIRKKVQKAVRQLALEEFSDQSCIQSSKGGIQHEKTC